jgi:hypothetical protein
LIKNDVKIGAKIYINLLTHNHLILILIFYKIGVAKLLKLYKLLKIIGLTPRHKFFEILQFFAKAPVGKCHFFDQF